MCSSFYEKVIYTSQKYNAWAFFPLNYTLMFSSISHSILRLPKRPENIFLETNECSRQKDTLGVISPVKEDGSCLWGGDMTIQNLVDCCQRRMIIVVLNQGHSDGRQWFYRLNCKHYALPSLHVVVAQWWHFSTGLEASKLLSDFIYSKLYNHLRLLASSTLRWT